MFNSGNSGYSLADVAAATKGGYSNNNDGFGNGNGAWWIIILFLFVFCGWGGNGFNRGINGGSDSALTRADLCQDMNFSDLESGVRGLQSGLCDGFYAVNTGMLNGFSGIQQSLTSGFSGVNNAICSLGYNTQQGFNDVNVANMQNTNAIQQDINAVNIANMQNTNALQTQLANCCCENRQGQADIKYQLATDTCAITNTVQNTTRDLIDNQNANTKSILDFLVQDKLTTLQAENQNLKLAASQAAQNQYLVNELRPCPVPAYMTVNPWACNCGVGYSSCANY